MDGKMEGWERLKGGRPVLTLCVRLTPIIAAIVLSAKCANHPLSRAGRPRLIHLGCARASSLAAVRGRSWRNWKTAGAWTQRSAAQSARTGALGGLLGAKSYEVGESCCDSWSVSSSAALGLAYPLSFALRFLIFS
jgi:hypothetical protein